VIEAFAGEVLVEVVQLQGPLHPVIADRASLVQGELVGERDDGVCHVDDVGLGVASRSGARQHLIDEAAQALVGHLRRHGRSRVERAELNQRVEAVLGDFVDAFHACSFTLAR
jgi:hypothetical protein